MRNQRREFGISILEFSILTAMLSSLFLGGVSVWEHLANTRSINRAIESSFLEVSISPCTIVSEDNEKFTLALNTDSLQGGIQELGRTAYRNLLKFVDRDDGSVVVEVGYLVLTFNAQTRLFEVLGSMNIVRSTEGDLAILSDPPGSKLLERTFETEISRLLNDSSRVPLAHVASDESLWNGDGNLVLVGAVGAVKASSNLFLASMADLGLSPVVSSAVIKVLRQEVK